MTKYHRVKLQETIAAIEMSPTTLTLVPSLVKISCKNP